ncbi:hypothetical protein ACFMQL_10920 [Nonomuraea fastidiosa]|jgi:hypothetical protein|uniref:hypothetical protein n=1 Tax=Nonomuraea TaxID=83681 RepID=UPI0032482D5E
MNRVVKTALAVTAFGLAAAAMAVPAQADGQKETAAHATVDAGGTTAAGPLGGILGGLTGGDLLGGDLLGGLLGKAKSVALPSRQMSEVERDRLSELQAQRRADARGNGFEDITRTGGPIPEISPIVSNMAFGGGALTSSLPLLGAARMAQPSVKADRAVPAEAAFSTVNGVLASPVGGAFGGLPGTALLPGSGSGVADAGVLTAGTVKSATKSLQAVSADRFVAGLSEAAAQALPHAGNGRLAPVVGKVAPAEVAPVVEALPATSQAVAVDELAPLVSGSAAFVASRGVKAAGAYSDVVTALGWTTDALTGSVRGVAAHH